MTAPAPAAAAGAANPVPVPVRVVTVPASRAAAETSAAACADFRPRPAHREPAFARYLCGRAVSLLGDQVWGVALAWSAVHLASAGVAGLLLTISSLPRLVLMLFGGVIADRFDIRRLMIGSDALRTLVALAAAAIAFLQPGIALLGLLAFVFGIVDAVFMPAAGAMQPRLLNPEQYSGGAVLTNLTARLALSVGAPLGGVLVAAGGVPLALAVDAATFAISVLTLATVRPRPLPSTPDSATGTPSTAAAAATAAGVHGRRAAPVWSELKAGVLFLAHHPVLGPMTLAFLLINIGFVGPMNIGIAELAQHRGWGASGIGLLLTGFGAGAAAGGLIAGRVRITRDVGLWIGVLGAVQGAALLGIALVPSETLTAGITSFIGVLSGPMAVASSVIQQRQTPDALRGRVSSLTTLINLGLIPLASAATGFLIAQIGITGDFAVSGLIEACGLLTVLAPAYRRATVES